MTEFGIFCVLICGLCLQVYADYDCLCNYRVETALYKVQDENTSPVAYMYEFDCKPTLSPTDVKDTWFAIMNEHAVAFVKKGDGLQVQVCAGSIPTEDKLFPTTQSPVTITSTLQKATSKPTTTTTRTTTSTTSVTMPTTTTIAVSTQTSTTTRPTSSSTLSTTLKTLASTKSSTASTTTSPNTKSTTQLMMSNTTAVWTRTTDWLIHWNITHAPYTTHYPYTHHHYKTSTKTHQQTTTDWLILWNITHPPFSTNFHQSSYQSNYSHGNLNLCPGLLRRSVDARWLRQYKSHCYELVHTAKTWHGAEADCWNRIGHGGELLEIYTEGIQNYIMNFLKEVNNKRCLWIGLEDIDREEHFIWDSGTKVTYTNWTPNRKGNRLSHGQEDCVMLLLNGKWDDMLCSHDGLSRRFLVNSNSINVWRPYICQYPTHTPHHG